MGQSPRIALVHDYLVTVGGAERAFLSIARAFPGAPIYTAIYRPETALPDFGGMDVRPLWSSRLPLTENSYRAGAAAFATAFEQLSLPGYDLVISSSSAFAKNAGRASARRMWYCYTPPRFIWPCGESSEPAGRLEGIALRPLMAPLRAWDRKVAHRVDRILAISAEVSDRVRRFYGLPAPVLHPPLARVLASGATDRGSRDGFLVVSRLNRYKAVDVAIEACRLAGERLTIIGSGSDEPRLRLKAGDHVSFRGRVTDSDLSTAYSSAVGVILPGEEDWGLTPVEANAHGTPAVAAARGGALETVIEGVTGTLYRPFGAEDLAGALRRLRTLEIDPARLRSHAAGFSETSFQDEIRRHASEVLAA